MRRIQKVCIAWLFFFATLLVYSTLVRADQSDAPEPLVGTFVFVEQFEPVTKIDVRVLRTYTEQAREDLRALKDEGYNCQSLPRQTFRCSQHQKLTEVDPDIRAKVISRIEKHLWFDFFEVKATVTEEVNNETYKRWSITQPVGTEYGTYPCYEWSWTQNLSKITLREDDSKGLPALYLNVGQLNDLNIQTSVSRTIDKNHFEIHIVKALYERGCFVGGSIGPLDGCREGDSVR